MWKVIRPAAVVVSIPTDVAWGLAAGRAATGRLMERRSGFVTLHSGGFRVIDLRGEQPAGRTPKPR